MHVELFGKHLQEGIR